ncbi:hypothetical protein HYW76_03750 [Candidatus Pacearchaeota archaeon]|nr:hypothetical protein [Candidatus Pacearchaeota archaeon]
MHQTALNIINLFRKTGSELSTSQIIEQTNQDYAELRKKAGNNKPDNLSVKREIAKFHRKTLHHLNKLIDFGILRVARHGERGEKFFSLTIGEDEEISDMSPRYKKRVVISRPVIPSMQIEGYEQKGVVLRYEPATWIDRLNSVVIFCEKIKDKNNLYSFLTESIFPIVNDAIDLENFEEIISVQDVSDFLEKMNAECGDYGKLLNVSINLAENKSKENLLKIVNLLSKNKLSNVRFIFSLQGSDLGENFDILSRLIEVFSQNKIILNIKNSKLQSSPCFLGKAGPYSFIDKEWQLAEELRGNVLCLGCSQSSAIVDVDKFHNEHGLDIEKFSQLMLNISKSVLTANSLQRRKSGEYFKSVNQLNTGYEADFLSLSRNYIRFWNFGLSQPDIKPEFVLNMISEAKKKIDEFSAAEETIYKSCGMTTRFKIALSCAFWTATKLSHPRYTKLEIKDFDDLYKKEIKKAITDRETICQIFDGGNEVTFHYSGLLDTKEIIRHIGAILSTYRIPLFNYNFENVKGDLKIVSFLK